MKKIISLLIVMLMISFCACGKSSSFENNKVDNAVSNEENVTKAEDSTSNAEAPAELGQTVPSMEEIGVNAPLQEEQKNTEDCLTPVYIYRIACDEKVGVYPKDNVALTISYGYKQGYPYYNKELHATEIERRGAMLFFCKDADWLVELDKYIPIALDSIEDEEGVYESEVVVGKLLTIAEFFATEEYAYEDVNGKYIFNHSETFVIPESLFVEGEGEIVVCFFLYSSYYDEGYGTRWNPVGQAMGFSYECTDGIVTIKDFYY